MLFRDRQDAGIRLADLLKKYAGQQDVVVLGLPRGGVVTAYEVARILHVPLDVTCPKKIGAPGNPEYAIGAVTETSEGVFNYDVIRQLGISSTYVQEEASKKAGLAKQRLMNYRKNKPAIPLTNKIVILVDDGLATGFTMRAAIQSVKSTHPKKVIVAVPVAPVDTLQEMKLLADEVVCLLSSDNFYAVGQFYHHFDQTEDQEVVELLQRTQE